MAFLIHRGLYLVTLTGSLRSLLPVIAVVFYATSANAQSRVPAVQEYQVEAVFLFNFTQFVDWPPSTYANAFQPMTICVLGKDPFGGYLDDTVRNEKVDNRSLAVRRVASTDATENCQVLFISRSESEHIEKILDSLKGRSILTVSDADAFEQRGGMIRFVAENSRIKLRINLRPARNAGLTISSKLLHVAESVVPDQAFDTIDSLLYLYAGN